MQTLRFWFVLLLLVSWGCSSSSGTNGDDASGDATTIDLSFGGDSGDEVTEDAGSSDTTAGDAQADASQDVREQDTGNEDVGEQDAGDNDIGEQDTGAEDTGTEDTGTEDTAATDTGSEDVATDTGSTDTGTEDTVDALEDAVVDTGSGDGDAVADTGSGPPTYTVGEFPNRDWSTELSAVTSTTINDFTASEVERGGAPGSYRSVVMKFAAGTGAASFNIHVLSWLAGASYSPGDDGALTSIDWSVSARHVDNDEPANRPALVVLLIRQGDTVYFMDPRGMTGDGENINCRWIWMDDGDECQKAGWNAKRYEGFVANAFARLQGAGPDHPDFSSSGEKLEFGYAVNYTVTLGVDTVSREVNVDNFSIRLNQE